MDDVLRLAVTDGWSRDQYSELHGVFLVRSVWCLLGADNRVDNRADNRVFNSKDRY
jgi:hypothetical protein